MIICFLSIVLSFNFTDLYLNEDYDNHTPYVVDPKTLSCEKMPLAPTAAVTLSVIYIAIFLLAVPGNLLVGWVIGTSRQTLIPSDVYLFHLTIADGLLALTIPFSAVNEVKGWLFGDFMCKLHSLVIEANFYTSILFLACISVDRYLVIVHASESIQSRQRMCSRRVSAGVWALGLALALPALFNDATRLNHDSEWMICNEAFDIGSTSLWRHTTRGFRHVFGFLLPLVVMITCYSITIARLLRTRGFKKHRAMKVIIAVVIAFLLCWMPYHITLIVDTLIRYGLVPNGCALRRGVNRALVITITLALSHSCINPFLYAFVGEKFRNKIKQIVQRKARQERMSGSKFSRSTSQTSEGNGAFL